MFTCPANDIHSVYLDNELEEPLASAYEAHLKNCAKCGKKLGELRKVRAALKDERGVEDASAFLSESWERLCLKRNYSEVSKQANPKTARAFKFALPLAAAAAFLALVLPLRQPATQSGDFAQTITPVTRNRAVPISKRNVIINGNITTPQFISTSVSNSVSGGEFALTLDGSDVFRPQFESSGVDVKIILPSTSGSFVADMPIFYTANVMP